MKKNKFLAMGLGLVVLFAACKKDISEDALASQTNQVDATAVPPPVLSAWTTVDQQATNTEAEAPVSFSNIADTAISMDVLEKGLVLVFAKTPGITQQLPFTADGTEWYYEITAGAVAISSKTADKKATAGSQSVQYIVFSSTQLSELESKGISKEQLLNLSYEKAVSLFKQS